MTPFVFTSDPGGVVVAGDIAVRMGSEISTREQLFKRLADGLKFPEYFGGNWDALDETLRDLHWVEGKRVVIIHDDLPRLTDDVLRTYVEILARAIEDWRRDEQHEFVVVFPEHAELKVRALLKPEA